MGKALVIKGVDFSENKLGTVTIIQDIPCAGISLNQTEMSLASIGATQQLSATVIPSTTTDNIVWTTADNGIATVSQSGLVTAVSVGAVIITATCGTKTATCNVIVTNVLSGITHSLAYYIGKANTSAKYLTYISGSNPYGCAYSEAQQADGIFRISSDSNPPAKYPFATHGATKITFENVPSTHRVTVFFVNSTIRAVEKTIYAMFIGGDANAYDSSVPLGNREVTVPEGADSFIFNLQYPRNVVSDADFNGLVITES